MRILACGVIAAISLSGCGGSQPSFDSLQNRAVQLWDAQDAQPETKWATVRDLTGTATYNGVGYFETSGPAVSQNTLVRGQMSIDATFSNRTPALEGTIGTFISETEQSLAGELRFGVNAAPDTFNPDATLRYTAPLTGRLQIPETERYVEIDASISGGFVGIDGQYITGRISDENGPMTINGGFVVQD